MGGNILANPVSVSMVVAIRKKMSKRNAMSAIDPALISGAALFDILYSFKGLVL